MSTAITRVPPLLSGLLLLLVAHALGDEQPPTTVAVVLVAAEPGDPQRAPAEDLPMALLDAVTAELSQEPGLQVVERQQLDLVLGELLLGGALGNDSPEKARLGKLLATDVIVVIQPLPKDKVLIRLVEPRTGVVRGATAATLDQSTTIATAAEIARYTRATLSRGPEAGVTLAVGVFENRTTFDQLRPLQRGLRDMLTGRLMHETGFRIVQRSDMRALIDELELIRSGLMESSAVPQALPRRESAYLLTGELEARTVAGRVLVTVRARLLRAADGAKVATFDREEPIDAMDKVAAAISRSVTEHLSRQAPSPPSSSDTPPFDEADYLVQEVIRDLATQAGRGITMGRAVQFLGGWPKDWRPSVRDDAGVAAIYRVATDRLECLRYLRPDDLGIKLLLAVCYGGPGTLGSYVHDRERVMGMFEEILRSDPTGKYGDAVRKSLPWYYSWIGNDMARAAPQGTPQAAAIARDYRRKVNEARVRIFEETAEPFRDDEWLHSLLWVALDHQRSKNYEQAQSILLRFINFVSDQDEAWHRRFSHTIGSVFFYMSETIKGDPRRFAPLAGAVEPWTGHESAVLRRIGHTGMAKLNTAAGRGQAAADWYARADQLTEPRQVGKVAREKMLQIIEAARAMIGVGQPQQAIELLTPMLPTLDHWSTATEQLPFALADAYVALGDRERALQTVREYAATWTDRNEVYAKLRQLGGRPTIRPTDSPVRARVVIPWDNVGSTYGRIAAGSGAVWYGAYGSVRRIDIASRQITNVGEGLGYIRAMEFAGGCLWLGSEKGLWRYNVVADKWTHWTTEHGLPSAFVMMLAAEPTQAFAVAGRKLVWVDPHDKVHTFDWADVPPRESANLFNSSQVVGGPPLGHYRFDAATGRWFPRHRPHSVPESPPQIAEGARVWLKPSRGFDFFPIDAQGRRDESFIPRWPTTARGQRHYVVPKFVVETSGRVWLGGSGLDLLHDAGLYSVDLTTGEVRSYGVDHGFGASETEPGHITGGVLAEGRLWVATVTGLYEVELSPPAETRN